jgi:hypothetical protein
MTSAVSGILARSIDSVRVNRCWSERRGDATVWLKWRRRWADVIILGGNVFLRLSNSRIQMFPGVRRWQRRELTCFQLLHGGEGYACGEFGARGVWLDAVPGTSLRELARAGRLDGRALAAAAREFARVHALRCPLTRRPWSHGDPHLANMVYDHTTGRARLIDFETMHDPRLDATERHADDVLTFLVELMSLARPDDWPGMGLHFLRAYNHPTVTESVRDRLIAPWPTGAEQLLWRTRTDHLPWELACRRLTDLRRAIKNCHHRLV